MRGERILLQHQQYGSLQPSNLLRHVVHAVAQSLQLHCLLLLSGIGANVAAGAAWRAAASVPGIARAAANEAAIGAKPCGAKGIVGRWSGAGVGGAVPLP